jgi:hypothetical protein
MDEARSRMRQAIAGFRLSQMISVASKLRLADLLGDGPLRVTELARLTRSNEDSLYRLLRALAGSGIFAEVQDHTFALTPEANYLRTGTEGSLRALAEVVGAPWMWQSWGGLMQSVLTGETAFDKLYGKDTWSYFAEDPEASSLFNELMEEISLADSLAVTKAFDFSGKIVVDLAGGQGAFLAVILERHLDAHGILFNLPHVIDGIRHDPGTRVELVAGNFFERVPPGGDLYVLKNILHDWEDFRALQILTQCRKAMSETARLLIIEHLIYGPNQPCSGKIGDIGMMVRNGGRNRTKAEFEDLLSTSGFALLRIMPTQDGPDLLEASVSSTYHSPLYP